MARSDLTAQHLRELLDYDPNTGVFTRRITRHKWSAGSVAGSVSKSGYVVVSLDYTIHQAHRLAWLYVYGEHPVGMLDHINGIKDDNRIANLRLASPTLNSENQRKPRSDNKSGFLGVYLHAVDASGQPVYRVRIQTKYKSIHVGLFSNPEEAHQAYVVAKRQLHGGCTL